MVYLLHRYFGRDGRDEADELLERHSGDPDHPRILGAFNEPTPDWLSFFFFTYFTDRDGKFQLASLRESGFDPLSRTCDFMLKEEAHHMFVGATGVGRVVQRTVELMKEHDTDDVAPARRHRRRHAAALPQLPLQRVARPVRRRDVDQRRQLLRRRPQGPVPGGAPRRRPPPARRHPRRSRRSPTARVGEREAPALAALNETLPRRLRRRLPEGRRPLEPRRWPRSGSSCGCPTSGFNRASATFAGPPRRAPTAGCSTDDEWARRARRLAADRRRQGPRRVADDGRAPSPGAWRAWIAPPATGIHQKPVDYEYVRV